MDEIEKLKRKIKSEQGWLMCLECSDKYDRIAIEKQKDYIAELEDDLDALEYEAQFNAQENGETNQ